MIWYKIVMCIDIIIITYYRYVSVAKKYDTK